jgi:ubiquinone/menaquinone biosynthesis C-methylase UbiE
MDRRRVVTLTALSVAVSVAATTLTRAVRSHREPRWSPSSSSGAARYEAVAGFLMGGFFDRVAAEVASACPSGSILEIGGGPGLLAERICRLAPGVTVTGADIDPAMVERADARARKMGLADRASFEVADVTLLPYADGRFDLVVSTLSMHHWADRATALSEIHRVLRPGGRAFVYDVGMGHRRPGSDGTPIVVEAARSPFRDGWLTPVRWPGRLVLMGRLELVRRP